MKNQALLSAKDTSKCRLLQFLFGALRVRIITGNTLCWHTASNKAMSYASEYPQSELRPQSVKPPSKFIACRPRVSLLFRLILVILPVVRCLILIYCW